MKFKKWISVLLISVLIMSVFSCYSNAVEPTVEDFTYEVVSGGISITGYIGTEEVINIEPSYSIGDSVYSVVQIGEYAFEGASITAVNLPDGLKKILEGAFYDCDSLLSVVIPKSVTTISDYAFDDCNNLTDITVLNAEASIGESAFGYYYSGRKYYLVENLVLRAPAVSTTEVYANENGIDFQVYVKKLKGDLNGDNLLDVRDLVRLKRILAGVFAAGNLNTDINGDTSLSAEDLVCTRILILFGEDNLLVHTVTFKDMNGNVIKKEQVAHGFAATAPDAPIESGYKFIGWSRDFKNVLRNISVTAEYESDTTPAFYVKNATAKAGDTGVVVEVVVKNNPGILGMTLTVDYDEDALTLKDATNGIALDGVLDLTKASVLKSGCNFVWDGVDLSDNQIKDGNVLTLKFDVSDSADKKAYPIKISYNNGDIIDADLNVITLEIENGQILVS